jgi:ABC-type amino acid transport substrate-binding protein
MPPSLQTDCLSLPTGASVNRRQSLGLLLALGASATGAQTELEDLAKIRAMGTLKVAVYKENPPFSDGKDGEMKGLDIAIAQGLAKQLKLNLALLPFDAGENVNDDLRNMVWRGHYLGYGPADVMLSVPVDKYLSQQNRQVVIFSPYMRQVPVVIHDAKVIPRIDGPDDLKGHKLAAERGTGIASALIGQQNGLLSSQVALFNSGVEAVFAVLQGRAAAAYVLRSQAESVLAADKAKISQFAITPMALPGLPENGWTIGLAVKTSNKDLGQALQAAMKDLRDSGELLAIFAQHGMTLTAP